MWMHTHDPSAMLIRRELHRHGLAQEAFRASVAQAAGLHDADVQALAHLSMAHSLTPTQLAARMRLTSGGTTALIERLKRRGYLVEQPNPSDARSRILTAIPDRAAELTEQYAALGAQLDGLIDRLPPGERAIVGSFLHDAVEVVVAATHRVDRQASERRTADSLTQAPGLWA